MVLSLRGEQWLLKNHISVILFREDMMNESVSPCSKKTKALSMSSTEKKKKREREGNVTQCLTMARLFQEGHLTTGTAAALPTCFNRKEGGNLTFYCLCYLHVLTG